MTGDGLVVNTTRLPWLGIMAFTSRIWHCNLWHWLCHFAGNWFYKTKHCMGMDVENQEIGIWWDIRFLGYHQWEFMRIKPVFCWFWWHIWINLIMTSRRDVTGMMAKNCRRYPNMLNNSGLWVPPAIYLDEWIQWVEIDGHPTHAMQNADIMEAQPKIWWHNGIYLDIMGWWDIYIYIYMWIIYYKYHGT